ncbi:DUF2232 domain-containing protein [Paraclostridium ghonii]|uniref:DUF2232 domain-containing protein n=1 Tax=Paraclostridium ghonii TaxID=29358 RepID=A0ABU0N0M6_9FIRM|nr:DUF2232 domain-containing protein [Paeniclostridium ghonii]MDQ0556713.1 hypothetical protein [Paeniclostridium ghonii]
MEIRKMTEAAIMSALFIVCSIFAITTGLLYGLYIQIIVPIFIAIIYLRCDLKFTTLAIITCLIIIGLVIGNIGSAICMSQSMIIGIMCGYVITKKTKILDDLFYLSVISCFIMVLIDIWFSKLIGFSFIKDYKYMVEPWHISDGFKEVMLYIFIATLPLGTVIITYFASLFIGDRIKSLKEEGKRKLYILKNMRQYANYIYCSKSTIYIGLGYLFIIQLKDILGIDIKLIYLLTVTETVKYIVYYFLIRDAYSYLRLYTYQKTKSKIALNTMGMIFLASLIIKFNISFWVISLIAFFYAPMKLKAIQ